MTDSRSAGGSTLLLASGATFLAFFDVTVVNVAFPDLRQDFSSTPLATLTWVAIGYAVVFAALLPAAGQVADNLGRRRIFLASLAVFGLASLACGVAPSIETVIAARIIQGVGAAGMIPAALGLTLSAADPSMRAKALGVWGAAGSVAAAAGPSVGGLLVEHFGWRSVFLINAPLVLVFWLAGLRKIPAVAASHGRLPDLIGTATATAGIVAVALALSRSDRWGWQSTAFLATMTAGVLLLVWTFLRARRHPTPAIDLTMWRSRTFAAASVASLLFGAVVFAWLLSGPLFLTSFWGYSIVRTGLALTPGALASAVAALTVGRIANPRGRRTAVVTGAFLLVIAALWLSFALTEQPHYLTIWLPASLLSGAGIGALLTGVATAAATSLAPQKFAAGTGLTLAGRQVGGALGIAVFAVVVDANPPELGDYRQAFLLCAAAALLGALAALGLTERSRDRVEVAAAGS